MKILWRAMAAEAADRPPGPEPVRMGVVLAVGAALGLLQWRLSGLGANLLCLLAAALGFACGFRFGLAEAVAAAAAYGGVLLAGEMAAGGPMRVEALGPGGLAIGTSLAGGLMRRMQRRSAEAIRDLERREAQLQSILDTVPDAMMVIDEAGTILSFSATAERMFGWTADAIVGCKVDRLMPAPYADHHDGYIAAYLRTGERKVVGARREVVGARADGSIFPMELHVGECRIGATRYFTGFVRDMTAGIEAERKAQELRVQLSHVWRLNSLGEMASVLSHELNQPLAAAANYLNRVRAMAAQLELNEDELLEGLELAASEVMRAGEIIRRMRGLVTRDAGVQAPVSLSAMIEEVAPIVALTAREAEVSVRYDLHGGDDRVMADRIQIQQVLTNLIRNAAEAMRGGAVRTLRVSSRPVEGDLMEVRVEDSGPGVRST